MKELTVALTFLLLAACGNVQDLELTYVGDWEGENMSLSISKDGFVRYERQFGTYHSKIEMPIKKFTGNDIVVGVLFFTTTFEVTLPPTQVDGEWQMIVDGVRLTKVTGDRKLQFAELVTIAEAREPIVGASLLAIGNATS